MRIVDKKELEKAKAILKSHLKSQSMRKMEKPDPKLIDSMCLRYRHDFGFLDLQEQNSIRVTMMQLWEEVVGKGFYRPDKRMDPDLPTTTSDLIDGVIFSLPFEDKMRCWELIEKLVEEETEEQVKKAFDKGWMSGYDRCTIDSKDIQDSDMKNPIT